MPDPGEVERGFQERSSRSSGSIEKGLQQRIEMVDDGAFESRAKLGVGTFFLGFSEIENQAGQTEPVSDQLLDDHQELQVQFLAHRSFPLRLLGALPEPGGTLTQTPAS